LKATIAFQIKFKFQDHKEKLKYTKVKW
jgi:hypothetical protein